MISSFQSLKNIKITSEESQKLKTIIETLEKDPRAYDFLVPVDYIAFGLTDYPTIIKKPMDLGTVKSNLKLGLYEKVGDCLEGLQLIWTNCKTYNMENSEIWKLAQVLEKMNHKLVEKHFKNQLKQTVQLKEKQPESDVLELKEEEKVDENAMFLTLQEKIYLTERVRKLPNEGLAEFVRLVQKECPSAFEDLDTERVQVRVDYLDKRTNELLHELMNTYLK